MINKYIFIILMVISSKVYAGGSVIDGGGVLAALSENEVQAVRALVINTGNMLQPDSSLNSDLYILTLAKTIAEKQTGDKTNFKIDWKKQTIEVENTEFSYTEVVTTE